LSPLARASYLSVLTSLTWLDWGVSQSHLAGKKPVLGLFGYGDVTSQQRSPLTVELEAASGSILSQCA